MPRKLALAIGSFGVRLADDKVEGCGAARFCAFRFDDVEADVVDDDDDSRTQRLERVAVDLNDVDCIESVAVAPDTVSCKSKKKYPKL